VGISKWNAGIIRPVPVAPAGPYENGAAPGVWTLDQVAYWQKQGLWPIAGNAPPYIEDVFSTYLYTGTGAARTITNGINLSANGGMVWGKVRSTAQGHIISDTVTGTQKGLTTNSTAAQYADPQAVTSFNSNGFTVGTTGEYNLNGATLVSWTFRKQPKFFDIVTYTGDGTQNRIISHNLGSTPGCMIVKDTSAVGSWFTWHRSVSGGLLLNTTEAAQSYYWDAADQPTSTTLKVSQLYGTNTSGRTYVAYLFAHNAGGFGLTGTDNVISCGSFVTTSGTNNITLGYEPQWLLVKPSSAASSWFMFDNMRGMVVNTTGDKYLEPNSSNAEASLANFFDINATGFNESFGGAFGSGVTCIYIAIRRGPMAVPTLGTSVFSPVAYTGTGSALQITSGFSADLWLTEKRGATQQLGGAINGTRLTGPSYRATGSTAADDSLGVVSNYFNWDNMTGMIAYGYDGLNLNGATYVSWAMRRAPGFFDVVCYTGTGATNNVAHNLGVAPELMIVKSRSAAGNWGVWNKTIFAANSSNIIILQSANASTVSAAYFNSTAPSSTTFTLGTAAAVNGSGATLVAYLFATCAGVSKVGSYTGTAALQTVACGFTTGARFVLIKRTDAVGDWYVWDSARGITSGNDPYLLMNSTAAEVTGTNYVDTDTTGFKVTAAAPAALNAVGGTYIFLAIA